MAGTIPIAANRNPITGRLESGFTPINPDNSWKVADGFRQNTSFDPIVIHPIQTGSSAYAYFKWATPNDLYRVPIAWHGAEYPVRLTILRAPSGATIGGLSGTQVFTRTLDGVTGYYIHSIPDDFGEFQWQPMVGDLGTTKNIKIRVEDNSGRLWEYSWVVDVSEANDIWIDSVNGNNANAGTFAAPLQTIAYAYGLSNTQTKIFRFKSGTYNVDADYQLGSTKAKSWIAKHGDTVNFNLNSGLFSNDYTDVTFMGINFQGGRSTAASVRNNWIDTGVRVTFHKCTFDITFAGTSGADNPSGIFFSNGTGYVHSKITITDCELKSTSLASLYCLFAATDVCIRNCTTSNLNLPNNNGSMFMHPKDGVRNISVVFCRASDCFSHSGMIAFSNQTEAEALNQEMRYCAIRSTSVNGSTWSATWNRANGKGTNQHCDRNTFVSNTQYPCNFQNPPNGEPVNVSGILYATTRSLQQDTAGATNVGQASIQVSDANINSDFSYNDSIKVANLGKTGHIIASPLVV